MRNIKTIQEEIRVHELCYQNMLYGKKVAVEKNYIESIIAYGESIPKKIALIESLKKEMSLALAA